VDEVKMVTLAVLTVGGLRGAAKVAVIVATCNEPDENVIVYVTF
jgi:hypothetical protein